MIFSVTYYQDLHNAIFFITDVFFLLSKDVNVL